MIYCLKHPAYRGLTPPVLACKTCCHIFISEVKRRRDSGEPMPAFVSNGTAFRNRKHVLANLSLKQQCPAELVDKSVCQQPR